MLHFLTSYMAYRYTLELLCGLAVMYWPNGHISGKHHADLPPHTWESGIINIFDESLCCFLIFNIENK